LYATLAYPILGLGAYVLLKT